MVIPSSGAVRTAAPLQARNDSPPSLRLVFTLVLPIAFHTTVPAEAILGRAKPGWMALALLVAGVSLTLGRAFWRCALRHDTSASS